MPNISKLARSPQAARLLQAAERLNRISRRARCPTFDPEDRDKLFPDGDTPIPLTALAFSEHDVITELLNMELDDSGQVEAEPWPILKMDGTDPSSIRQAFRRANVAVAHSRPPRTHCRYVPGFEAMTKHNPYGV